MQKETAVTAAKCSLETTGKLDPTISHINIIKWHRKNNKYFTIMWHKLISNIRFISNLQKISLKQQESGVLVDQLLGSVHCTWLAGIFFTSVRYTQGPCRKARTPAQTSYQIVVPLFCTVSLLYQTDWRNACVLSGALNTEFFDFASLAWKRLFTSPRFGFLRCDPLNGETYQRNPKRHILARVRVVWAIMRENSSTGLTCRWVPEKGHK